MARSSASACGSCSWPGRRERNRSVRSLVARLPFPASSAVGTNVPFLEPLLAAAVLAGAMLALLAAGLAGYRLARRRSAPQRSALRIISELTPEGLKRRTPAIADKLARAALTRLWALTDPVMTRQRQLLPFWLDREMPCMAAPLLDAQGQRIGIVALTSRRRPAYTVEDGAFLRTVIGHAAMAIQNATLYQFIDTLSRIDPLTGLHNRREFDRLLQQELGSAVQTGLRLSLIMADIDHFKQINDRFGHQEGDRALQQMARLIQLVPRRATDAGFRLGGEEFAVLMGDTGKAGAVALSETLRGVIEGAKFLPSGEPVTVSLGVATFPDDGQNPAILIAAADRALYQAKAGGRNRVAAA